MKIKEYLQEKENTVNISVFIIVMLIACAPLISPYCINGHDLEYHLLRIESLKDEIIKGIPFLRVNTLFFGNAGYASSMFYPDFLLYIPALLRVVGVSINASYHLFVALMILLCYLSGYFCVRGITGSKYAGTVAAVLLTLCQYHLDDIYVRSAVGEYTAFIFVPIVIYGLYNLLCEDFNRPYLLAAGYVGVLLCHTSTFVMCLLLGFAAFVIYAKQIFGNKKIVKTLIITIIIAMAVSSFYWLPLLEQFISSTFYVSIPWMKPEDEAVSFYSIFSQKFPSLGSIVVFMCIPRIFIRKSDDNRNNVKFVDCMLIAGIMFTLLSCDMLPWGRLGKYLSFIQFPWRFFIMGSVLFSMSSGVIFKEIISEMQILLKDKKLEEGISTLYLCFIVILSLIFGVNSIQAGVQGYYDYSNDYYSYVPYTANVIAGEWLPITVTDKEALISESERMLDDKGNSIEFNRSKNTVAAIINSDTTYIDVPFIYYLGYKAYIEDQGIKKELRVSGDGKNGLCRVYTDGNTTGTLKVKYGGTLLQKTSDILSILTFVGIVAVYIRKKQKISNGGRNE